jgi:(S)-2-hydroxyglutarate dehydrogenase
LNNNKDIAIIGGGIVGLATALTLSEKFPRHTVILIDKESELASHQTGHNSGVIHAGIYYKPGSAKARLCVSGVRRMETFCEENGVPVDRCGKLIVATSEEELPRLQTLLERGTANGIPGLKVLTAEQACEIEPHASALQALHSPGTSIVDFKRVTEAMAAKLAGRGVEIVKKTRLLSIAHREGRIQLETSAGSLAARNLISCAGLHSDQVARLAGVEPGARIIPFRGEYYNLREDCRLVKGLIYPVPDPQFPFLGVHFTKRIEGSYEAGPNAVLAFAREGYRKTDFSAEDFLGMMKFAGFWAMARRYWQTGFYEYYRSFSRAVFLKALRKLVPELQDRHLAPGGSGVRAQAVRPDGTMVDDFLILESERQIHVINAPSPAATASLSIGEHIAGLAEKSFSLS